MDAPAARAAERRWRAGLLLVVVLAAAIRLAYLLRAGDALLADEAVAGLMALKIAQGVDFPLMTWEAHYGGTLVSWIAAGLFHGLPPSPFVLRLAALPLGLAGVAAGAAAARAWWGTPAGLVAGLVLAAPPATALAFATHAIDGYPDTFAAGALLAWWTTRIAGAPDAPPWRAAVLGLLGGLAIASQPFALPVFAASVLVLRRTRPRALAAAPLAAALVAGLAPLLLHNVAHPGASLLRLGGRVLGVSRADVAGPTPVGALVADKALAYLGREARFPAALVANAVDFFGVATLLVATAVLVALAAGRRGPVRGDGVRFLGWSTALTVAFLALLQLDAPRHLLPLTVPAALAAAAAWAAIGARAGRVASVVLAAWLVTNVGVALHAPPPTEPPVGTLRDWLLARGRSAVYTDFAVAYPLTFLSRERIVASPAAGPLNAERYPPYTRAVDASPAPAYVFLADTEASAVFAREIARAGVPAEHHRVDAFDVYLLDRPVRPGSLALLRRF